MKPSVITAITTGFRSMYFIELEDGRREQFQRLERMGIRWRCLGGNQAGGDACLSQQQLAVHGLQWISRQVYCQPQATQTQAVGRIALMIELTVTTLAHGGAGLGHHDGKAVFVFGAIPGDRIRLQDCAKQETLCPC